jgi:hypothetical protein
MLPAAYFAAMISFAFAIASPPRFHELPPLELAAAAMPFFRRRFSSIRCRCHFRHY